MAYFLNSWAWSIGGLVIGYLLGRTERTMREIMELKKKVDEIGDHDDHP